MGLVQAGDRGWVGGLGWKGRRVVLHRTRTPRNSRCSLTGPKLHEARKVGWRAGREREEDKEGGWLSNAYARQAEKGRGRRP